MSDGRATLPEIEAVIFDYGEVLCYPPRVDEIARMAGMFGVEPKLFPPLWEKNRAAYDRGDLSPEIYWRMLSEDAGVEIGAAQFAELNELDAEMWGRENPRMVEWMLQIAAAGIKTALLSNMHPEMVRYVRRKFEWVRSLTPAIFSAEVRMVKPDAAIYRHTLQELGLPAHKAMFIDDREGNVRAAQALGIHAVQMKSMSQLKTEVEALGFPVAPTFSATDELASAAIKM
jgi:putative hydrolase of the HAD superfamily